MTSESVKEEWRPVVGFDGYEVSNQGRVKSFKYKEPKVLKEGTIQHGYKNVVLMKDGKKHTATIHRLVLTAFCREPLEGEVCRHLDGNTSNNCINNLAWGSQLENSHDRYQHNTMGKLSEQQVLSVLQLSSWGWKGAEAIVNGSLRGG
jgi:hypothetical protein